MKFILGTKLNMTQVFDEEGNVHPVTVLSAGPVVVTALRSSEVDGYSAVQVGFGTRNPKNINKAQKGHFKELGNFRYVKEFRADDTSKMNVGDKIDAGAFVKGDKVIVSAVSKGKGFQGVVKRHGFGGGPRSHGQKHSEREAGSIGGGLRTGPRKGMRMAGRMGADRITVKNLLVVGVDAASNTIHLRGAVPGRRGTLVELRAE